MIGLAPSEVLAMPLHDYQAALHHFARANSSDDDGTDPLSSDDFDDMIAVATSAGLH